MRILYLMFILLGPSIVNAQNEAPLFFLNHNLQTTSADSAVIVARRGNADSAFRVNCFLIKTGQLVLSVDYADSTLVRKNGVLTEYHGNGQLARLIHYRNDVQEGSALKWNVQGQMIDSAHFVSGRQVSICRYNYAQNTLANTELVDENQSLFQQEWYHPGGHMSKKVVFIANRGQVITYDKNGVQLSSDSVFTRKRTSAEFKGGASAWRTYLERTLNAKVPVSKGAPPGVHTVKIRFIINKDGTVSDIKPDTQVGYGMEEEAVNVISSSSKRWIPATEYGLPVRSYRVQPISFSISM